MIKRTTNVQDVLQAVDPYLAEIKGFHPEEWLANPENVALINDSNDVSLFERLLPAVVMGHYFYHSRGRAAIDTATAMLEEIFTGDYNVEIIEGLTPLERLGARWLSKKLGFKSHGVTDTIVGPCEIVILTKDEWRSLNE